MARVGESYIEKRSQEDEGKGSVPVIVRQPEWTERSKIQKNVDVFLYDFLLSQQ